MREQLPSVIPGMVVAAFLAFILVLQSENSWAQAACPTVNRANAVRLAKRASVNLNSGNYSGALEDLRSAYALCPEAQLRHAMGCVQEASGALTDALASFRECVRESDDNEMRLTCMTRTDELQKRLERGTLIVEATPREAQVYLDGSADGQPAGIPMAVKAGRHVLEVRAPEKAPHRTTLDVAGGQEVRLEVTLEPEAAKPLAPMVVQPDARAEAPPMKIPPVATATRRPSTVWNWVGVGLSAAFIGVGAGFLGQYGKDRSDAHGVEYFPANQCTPGAQNPCIRHDADRVSSTNVIVGSVCAGVGLAALITSVVLWPKAPATVSAAPTPGGGMVSLGGTW